MTTAQSHVALRIDRRIQSALAVAGSICLILYWRSWKDLPHLVYDIPSALAMCAFMAQIVGEGLNRQFTAYWYARLIAMIPLSAIPSGREFFNWHISGHLTDILAVALLQTFDGRLGARERTAYWIPIPIILYCRLFIFDKNGHWETVHALIGGLLIFGGCLLLARLLRRSGSTLDT